MGQGELPKFGVYFDFRACPIAPIFRELSPSQGWSQDIFPCPCSSSLPQGSVLHASIQEEGPSSSSGIPGSGRRVWDHPGCEQEARRRFWLELSAWPGWDEGSGAGGMLQQEFQAGFAPGG